MKRILLLAASTMLLIAASAGDSFDRAVRALREGSALASRGSSVELRTAALALHASGAMPVDGNQDLAERWIRIARADLPTGERDRALGPGYRVVNVAGGASALFEQTFLAGQRARVAVVPGARSDFSMIVADDDRNVVCRASSRNEQCDWVPSYTSRFRIELHNPKRDEGNYYLIVQ